MNDNNFHLTRQSLVLRGDIHISASKSESNRLLVINALAEKSMELGNLSEARDTQTMIGLLNSSEKTWDVKDAGTTMRFLTAFLSIHGDDHLITGTERMKQRPIGPLVDSLSQLGASVQYEEQEGFPPLRISKIRSQEAEIVQLPGNISSQYISALLMIAPCLPKGLTIEMTTEIFSRPYIQMTLNLMALYGVEHEWKDRTITIKSQRYLAQSTGYDVESDWSGSSYWYAFVSLAEEGSSL